MRTLKIINHMSLDGVIQNSPEDGFPYPDWGARYRNPEGRDVMLAAYGARYDVLIGRRTYDLWSAFWPHVPAGDPFADRLRAATKYVVTHRPDSLEWGPAEADELVVPINPVLVGAGKRLFAEGTPGRTFELTGTTALPSGIVVCAYTLGEPLPLA